MLIALGTVARLLVFILVPVDALPQATRYLDALREHLGQYVLTNTYRPPLTYVIHGLIAATFGSANAASAATLLVTFVFGVVTTCLTYLSAISFRAHPLIALALAGLFSLGLIPFELWRGGAHYDHHTPVLAALFTYACARSLGRATRSNLVLLGVAGTLFVLQSPSALYVVPATVVAVGIAWSVMRRPRAVLAWLAIFSLAMPLVVGGLLIAKNRAEAGISATGNQSGSTLLIFVQDALRAEPGAAASLVADTDVTAWFRWCYDRPVPPPGSQRDPTWDILARAYGVCSRWTDPSDELWPFDLRPLLEVVRAEGATGVAGLLERDIVDMRERRWLYEGFSAEQTSRWTGAYGNEAPRIALRLVLTRPFSAARSAALSQARYAFRGPLLSHRTLAPPSENGMRTLPGALPVEPLFQVVTLTLALVLGLTYLALPFALGILTLRGRRGPDARDRSAVLGVLAAPVWLLAGIFTIATWDVDRYFMQSTPYLLVVAALLATWILGGSRTFPRPHAG